MVVILCTKNILRSQLVDEMKRVSTAKLKFQEDQLVKFKWFQGDLETILLLWYAKSDPP